MKVIDYTDETFNLATSGNKSLVQKAKDKIDFSPERKPFMEIEFLPRTSIRRVWNPTGEVTWYYSNVLREVSEEEKFLEPLGIKKFMDIQRLMEQIYALRNNVKPKNVAYVPRVQKYMLNTAQEN